MQHNEPVDQTWAIINTASVAAFEGQMGQAATVHKGGIVGIPCLRATCQNGYPCKHDCAWHDQHASLRVSHRIQSSHCPRRPLPQRLGEPEEIGKLVIAIIDNDYINGETIRMDGGIRMQPG